MDQSLPQNLWKPHNLKIWSMIEGWGAEVLESDEEGMTEPREIKHYYMQSLDPLWFLHHSAMWKLFLHPGRTLQIYS